MRDTFSNIQRFVLSVISIHAVRPNIDSVVRVQKIANRRTILSLRKRGKSDGVMGVTRVTARR